MIANSSGSNKLKASKGFKETDGVKLLVSDDKSRVFERGEGNKDKYSGESLGVGRSSYSSSVVYRSLKPRQRQRDDFRIVRGATERRGTGRGTGRGSNYRKVEKDGEVYVSRSKFQESLSKGKSSDGISSFTPNKYGVDYEGGKSKSADYGNYLGLPEDSRISKVLRRMSREDDPEKFIAFCNQLQEAIVAVDNSRYIRRALDLICESLLDMLHSGPNSEAKRHAAKCLGKLGYTLDQDFKRFMDWMFSNYTLERNDDVRALLLQGVLETVNLERERPKLKDFAMALMNNLHVTLEAVDKAHLLLIAVEVILNFASIYPDLFTKYFTDTVDILVGWHIDPTTPYHVTCYASQSLQRLSHYWANDLDFSLTMLGHFVEDTEAYTDELLEDETKTSEEKLIKVTGFIKVFNSVMKGLGQNLSPAVSPSVSWTFITDCLSRMLTVMLKVVCIHLDFELVISGNECTWLLLNVLQNKTCTAHEDLYQVINYEITVMDKFTNTALSSLLQLISKVVKELSANLPLELVQRILKPDSPFLDLRFSSCKTVHQGIVAIYHSLLSLKNIPLLKEAYRLILEDLDSAYRVLVPALEPLCGKIESNDRRPYTLVQAESIILFHLKALTDIANASNSLIGMWVLQPSILDLLAVKLIPQTMGRVSTSLFFTQLYLLYSHCSRHSHFITTSSLVGGSQGRPTVNSLLGLPGSDIPQLSPTSGHFSVIIALLSDIIKKDMCEESYLLVLRWCGELLAQCRPYFTTLASTLEMTGLVNTLCTLMAESLSASVLLAACANLEQLLMAPYTLYLKKPVLEKVLDVCLLHVNSTNCDVAARYSALMFRLPWTIVVPNLHLGRVNQKSSRKKIEVALHTVITTEFNTGGMTSHHFKQYMAYLLQGKKSGELGWLQDVFSRCWSLTQTDPHDFDSLRELALSSLTVLFQWATWQSAELCVSSKLRTPLGKPLDTFMAFEGAIKSLARLTVGSSSKDPVEEFDICRVRLLLEFVEQLEKSMYNASDGTATALITPTKPVRTFFHTNKSTCNEWLSRNRNAVVGVALHIGMASSAIRHGYALLQDLLDVGNIKGSEFENTVLQVGRALFKLKQPEAILGLYVWCRDIIGIKFSYLKALADHASGKLEAAVESFTKMIYKPNDESLESPSRQLNVEPEQTDSFGHAAKTMMADQITECYLALQDWSELVQWKTREVDLLANQNGGNSSRYKYMTCKTAESMLAFDREDYTSASELMEWTTDSEINKPAWDSYQLLGTTTHKLTNIAIKSVASGVIQDSDKQILRECQAAAHCYLVEGLRNTPSEVVQEAAILEFAASAMLSESDVIIDCAMDGELVHKMKNVDSVLLARILWWGNTLEKLSITSLPSPQLSLDAARLARKEGNLKLALKQLSHHMSQILLHENGNRKTLQLTNNLLDEMDKCAEPWTLPQAMSFAELAKLLYSTGNHELAVNVGAKACIQLADCEDSAVREKCARLLLTVAKWVPLLDSTTPTTAETIHQLMDWQRGQTSSAISLADVANFDFESDLVGSLLHLAVGHYPNLAKAWAGLAAWSYRWGRKVTDQILTPVDKESINDLIPENVDRDKVYEILTHATPPVEDDDIEAENITQSETVESELRQLDVFTAEQLTGLVEMWRKSHTRTYNYYQLSAHSYFRYLQLCENPQEDSEAITATLRLLRLIVKHAEELQSVLEVGLSTTPTLPWVCIIPQLFSRLSHPQPYVRRRVSELLCRLAADKPHLIIFPSVVGSDAGAATIRDMPRTKLFNHPSRDLEEELEIVEEDEEEFEEDEEESHDGEESQAMENCFQAMVDILAKQDPEAISQVQLFVRELRRITLLWDELWLGTLQQHHSNMSRRIHYLEQEVTRVDDNPHLSSSEKDRLVAENYSAILKPLLFVLEQLHEITSVTAETPHEVWFQEKFGENIRDVLEKLQSPSDVRKPNEAWSALKALQLKLQQRANKRASYSMRMKDISPTLAEMKNTQISMPGMKIALTVARIHDHVAVLPTKTKPKKLVFQGCDGKQYTYLFKGLEDLHLDERIMQFLSIANTMLRGSGYQARHYSVIPLGLRSGLISWVEGVTPLFSLYKRWQQRQASITQSTVMRPSELFYAKLTPLLTDCDVTKHESRVEWPLSALKQVLTELMQETPTYLLSRELWCDSVNAGSWWQITKLYSTSLAVMSIIGYIIGLGDRHLDNVLVDLTTGQVVHIDYNVCFEKGKNLRVPEKVPFRLTPNLRAALGVTGVEGLFRLTCEHVLKVMKKGRETVLTLLEAFVYDPLIDWTLGNEIGYTGAVYGGGRAVALETKQSRKQLEKEVATAMFNIRKVEMKYCWLENRDKILAELPQLAETMQKWLTQSSLLKAAEDTLQERHQLMALVKEAEAHATHDLYSLPARYATNRAAAKATDTTCQGLQAKLDDCARQIQQYNMALCYFYGPQMAQWVTEVNSRNKQDSYLVFDLIKEFLQNAGQSQMVVQCIQSEKELCELCCQQTQLTRACLDLLGQYGAIVRQFPVSHVNSHRFSLYHRWAATMLEAPCTESCELVINEMKVELLPPTMSQATQALGYNLGLQRLLAENRAAVKKLMERRSPLKEVDKSAVDRMAEQSPVTFKCVIVTALGSLNKRFLVMESAAKSAMDCLVDLTSQKGEWFFDDMCLTTSIMIKLLSLLPIPEPDSDLNLALKCLQAAHNQYKSLQELNLNFSSIILPEAVQTIQREDPSVLNLIAELDIIVASIQMPLGELVKQLQMHLHFVVIGMESPHEQSYDVALRLQKAIEAMFQRLGSAELLTPGQMLFMGFNGLFDNLNLGASSLIQALAGLNMPTTWKTIDQLRDAKILTASVHDSTHRAILGNIFLVKRLQAMQELFALCRASGESFKGCGAAGMPYDDDRLNRPIRRFTADYVSYQLLGVFSHTLAVTICFLLQQIGLNVTGEVEQREVGADSRVSLEDLCRAAVDLSVRQGAATSTTLSQVSVGVSALETAWRGAQLRIRLGQELQRAELTTQRLQVQLTAHCWLHEDALALGSTQVNLPAPPISRHTFMLELRKALAALLSVQPRLAEVLEQQSALVGSAEQRLKWGAGANPALAEVMCAFETTVKNNNEQLVMEQQLAALVANLCNSVLLYEVMRTRTTDAVANDAAFMQVIEVFKQSCLLYQSLDTQLTPLEESLVKLCPPDSQIDWKWIAKAESIISDSVKALMLQMEPMRVDLFVTYDGIKTGALSIRSLLVAHYRTLGDARSLLKTMAKFEEQGVSEYLSRYRAYTERLTVLIKTVAGLEEVTPEKTQGLLQEIAVIQGETPGIYEDLLRLPVEEERGASKRPPLVRQDSVCVSPRRDPHTGKAVQERNAYALSVWRRVRLKLEGRDPDVARKYSVQEQVDWCINEATSLDNLALLYEGWTPWV